MPARSSAWLDAADVTGLPPLIAFFIWHGARLPLWTLLILPLWLVASFLVHRDTPKTLGMRADNLGPATREATIVFAPFLLVLIAIGIALHQPLLESLGQFSFGRLSGYTAFCLLQQVALNSLFTNRLLSLFRRLPLAALGSGLIFAAMHWPNPVLVPCTFIGGVAMAWLFARHRNILPLAVGQAVLGVVISIVFPVAWHHQMRVGPGYYLPYGH